ncbi:MAG: D-2-hydroxyacid dehydrogenase [Bacteroidales bacterium]|nr:D-2-hydroxyacid dehydrogenase [Bacteroidales bacterium]MDD2424919.1 D-2-hydroxyacid dehydrogenase [Bacteroidales bacterium]MDD2684389.1 D-2-hydroxyacid dehydrogenase [Candidatus Cloacimonadota bacterium]MDD3989071.1 D-2-hydroxyacid dehydrogenase [Bacteroidales bacterium]MDD4638754.1 D-2-hydroxyacid dehydrogenase [Bacteroidales bacterium]
MKIVFLDAATMGEDISLSSIESLGELVCWPSTPGEDVKERIKEADIVITNKVVITKDSIDSAPNLKLICVAATGTNNVDIEYAGKKGIPVRNAVGYSTESVLQITFTLILGLLSKLKYFDNYVKDGSYSSSGIYTNVKEIFCEIKGKKFGIIGMGNIGSRVASVASAFGAEICYYSTSGTNHCVEYPSVSLKELLSGSDIVSIHAPLNPATNNLISLEQMGWMKKNAILINMGRGGIVNEKDLAYAIDNGLIAGAGVDVFVKEPFDSDHPYMMMEHKERVLFTPHIGWASAEARKRVVEIVTSNIRTFIGKS